MEEYMSKAEMEHDKNEMKWWYAWVASKTVKATISALIN